MISTSTVRSLCALVLLASLPVAAAEADAAADPVPAEAQAEAEVEAEAAPPVSKPKPPRTRFVYRTLNVFRYNPLGLISDNHLAMRYRLFEPDSLLFSDTYVGLGITPTLSGGYSRIGVLAEVKPLALIRLWTKLEMTGYYGIFDHLQSFRTAGDDFSDGGLSLLGELAEENSGRNYATWGFELTLGMDLQMKLGPIAARNLTRAVRGDYKLRGDDRLYYDPQYDVLAPNRGWFISNDTDLLYVSDFGLVAGVRANTAMPFYDASHYRGVDPADAPLNGPTFRAGPLVAYTFFDDPGAWFNKPTLLAIVNWNIAHRWRTGADVHQAIPYALVGFIMVGDLLPWR
jgi:hypothetical protein